MRAELGFQHVVAADRAGQWLDEGGVFQPDMVGQHHAVAERYRYELGGGTGLADPDGVPPLAHVVVPDLAVVALVAVQRRVDRDPLADAQLVHIGADRGDGPRELVPGDDGQRRREFALEDVQVGAADAAGGHLDDDLARTG